MKEKLFAGARLLPLAIAAAVAAVDVGAEETGQASQPPPIAAGAADDPHAGHRGEAEMISVGAEPGKSAPTPLPSLTLA